MHAITRLYSKEFDRPKCSGPLRAEVMIATIPRSGSTHFCLEACRTGALGVPMEYPRALDGGNIFRRLGGPGDGKTYWDSLRTVRVSENNVFAYKMFVQDYGLLNRKFPDLLPYFAPTAVIKLIRKDRIAQAVSYSRAIRSQAWFAGVSLAQEVRYDFEHILKCMRSIIRQEQAWNHIFELTRTAPILVSYEDVLADRTKSFQRIFKELNLEWQGSFETYVPALEVQRDGESLRWAERFRQDLANFENGLSVDGSCEDAVR